MTTNNTATTITSKVLDKETIETIASVAKLADSSANILIGLLIITVVLAVVFVIFPLAKGLGGWITMRLGRDNPLKEAKDGVGELSKLVGETKDQFTLIANQILSIQVASDVTNTKVLDAVLKIRTDIASVAYDVNILVQGYANVLDINTAIHYADKTNDALRQNICMAFTAIPKDITNKSAWIKTQVKQAFNEFDRCITRIAFEGCHTGMVDISDWSADHAKYLTEILCDYITTHDDDKLSFNEMTSLVGSVTLAMQKGLTDKMKALAQKNKS